MQIELSPELEAVIRRKVETGEFESPDACIAGAIQLLEEQDRFAEERPEAIRLKIEKGWQQSERGEVLTSEEVWSNLEATRAHWIATSGRSAA